MQDNQMNQEFIEVLGIEPGSLQASLRCFGKMSPTDAYAFERTLQGGFVWKGGARWYKQIRQLEQDKKQM